MRSATQQTVVLVTGPGAIWPSRSMRSSEILPYGLLDERVCFLAGWFRYTLPSAPIERLAVLRLDGDMYESTMDALAFSPSQAFHRGYVIVDDYGAVPACKAAV